MNEIQYFSALLHTADASGLRALDKDHLTEDWRGVYEWVVDFQRTNKKLPRPQTLAVQFSIPLAPAPESAAYYAKKIRENAMRAAMEEGFSEKVVPPLANFDPRAAIEATTSVISEVKREFPEPDEERSYLVDISDNVGEQRLDYQHRANSQGYLGIPLPWQSMTRATGGMQPGDGWCIASRPNTGKSWALVVISQFLYMLGYRVLFASMETPPRSAKPKNKLHRIRQGRCVRCQARNPDPRAECDMTKFAKQRLTQRFTAVGARVSAWRLLNGNLQPQEKRQVEQYWSMLEDAQSHGWGKLTIVSPPTCRNVEQAEQLIIEHDPDIFLWDSAYLAIDRKKGKGGGKRSDQAGYFLQDTKAMLERTEVAGIISWHFNREVNSTDTTASMNDIALTDDMGRIFDVIWGLFQPPELKDAGEAFFRSLKVRDGVEAPEIKTRFSMKRDLRFDEISSETGVGT